jgi:hypothetical protein
VVFDSVVEMMLVVNDEFELWPIANAVMLVVSASDVMSLVDD